TVHNVAPLVDAGGDETLRGGKLDRTGSFHDPGADAWVAFVDDGDGSGPQPLHLGKGGDFRLHHRYRAPGVYRVTVIVVDDDGALGEGPGVLRAGTTRSRGDYRINPVDPVAGVTVAVVGGREATLAHYRIKRITSACPAPLAPNGCLGRGY